eukprot:TRINITY_DN4957_c0_g1_i4.p1 TRINITY_DN4957_c0_g1~~TRINITY_DN4957_c0_g1_i4.p1  ORF type:complete len:115 (-),score=5.43 TRINITY_DN4957_c0_g1_i4:85-429(-)
MQLRTLMFVVCLSSSLSRREDREILSSACVYRCVDHARAWIFTCNVRLCIYWLIPMSCVHNHARFTAVQAVSRTQLDKDGTLAMVWSFLPPSALRHLLRAFFSPFEAEEFERLV